MIALERRQARIELYNYLKKTRLVTCRGLILLNLAQHYPRRGWETNFLKICDGWSRSHVHASLEELENEGIIESIGEEETGRRAYKITEQHWETIQELEGLLARRMSQ